MFDAISSGSYLTVAQAADQLDISVSRVNKLIAAGDLRSSLLGTIAVVLAADVERRRSLQPRAGRRLTPANAWGIIAMASGEKAPWLAPDTRYRLRLLLTKQGLSGLRPRLVDRGSPFGYRAHSSVLRAIRDDDALMLTGVTAAAELRLGLLAGSMVDGYVSEAARDDVVARYRLLESRGPNVVLRAVPAGLSIWPGRHLSPRAAVALDLLEDADPRSREIGDALLERLRS